MDILNLSEHIRTLEESLLHQDFSSNPEALEAMLSREFREVNPDGKIVSRQSVINWLQSKNQHMRWEFNDFEVCQPAPGLVQATYHARCLTPDETSSKGALHSSLWKESGADKNWQMIFHQSTRVNQ